MTITINSGQATLSKRSSVTCVPLVVLETFTDRDAGTVEDRYFWTRGHHLKFKWDGSTGVFFEPRILRITPISRMFEHIPNARTFETREVVRITIDATPRAGHYIWNDLQDSNLIGARVQISSLLIDPPGNIESEGRYFDLTGLGEVQTKRWAGELTLIEAFDDEAQTITLVCETEEPALTSLRRLTGFPRAHPEDVGKVMPLLVGTVNEVKPLRFESGGANTLLIAINSSVLTIDVLAELEPRPFGGIFGAYIILIGSELIQCTSVADQGDNVWRYTVHASGRGHRSTTPASHALGTVVWEVRQYVAFLISGQTIYDIGPRVQINLASGGIQSLEFGDTNDVKRGNFYLSDLGGTIGVVVLSNYNAVYAGAPDSIYVDQGQNLLVDAVGSYEVGSSPTTLLDLDGDESNWEATNFVGIEIGGDVIEAITDGVRYTMGPAQREYWFYRNFSPGEVVGDVELTFTLGITQASLDDLLLLMIFTNKDSGNRYHTETHYIQAEDLVDGDNEIRMSILADTIDNFGIKLVTSADDVAIDITGLIETFPITSLSNHPIDVLDYVVDELAPTAQFVNDSTTFAAAKTATPSVGINADIAASANTFAALLADIGFNSRINFIFTESQASPSVTTLKAFAASTSSTFGSATRSIGSLFRSLIATPRIITELANRFSAIYDAATGSSSSSASSYRKSLTADEVSNPLSTKAATSLITASQTDYGIRPSDAVPFDLLNDEASVIEVFGYYVRDALNTKAVRYSCVVPFSLGYDLEPGDIVDILPRWEASAVKVRVTGTSFDFDIQAVGLNLQEVL